MNHLDPTPIVDFETESIQHLIEERGWRALSTFERIGAAYSFVKDEIEFGYNASDSLAASDVLNDGYGQCNTKGNLLMALLRGLDIKARFHGFTIDKSLQKGAIPTWLYALAPQRILHSWVEVYFEDSWVPLEGFILDPAYLKALQARFPNQKAFCGFAAGTPNLQEPDVEWRGQPTYIQREGIVDDFGVFDSPDEFYAQKGTNLSGVKKLAFQYVFRHAMNATVKRIRMASGSHKTMLLQDSGAVS